MLSRIENVYLAILRIVVLVAATVALIAAILGLVTGLPALSGMLGLSKPDAPYGGTLGEYIEAKRATVDAAESTSNGSSGVARKMIDPLVREAATEVQTYLKGQDGANKLKLADWEDMVIERGEALPTEMTTDYYADNLALIKQLRLSKGKKLSVQEVQELIAWNAGEFATAANINAVDYQMEQAEAQSRLTWAAGAFLLFLMVIFTFLFVKVERSLRLVRTVRENTHAE